MRRAERSLVNQQGQAEANVTPLQNRSEWAKRIRPYPLDIHRALVLGSAELVVDRLSLVANRLLQRHHVVVYL